MLFRSPSPHQLYATYGTSYSHSGSQRSSVADIYGTTHDPGCSNHPLRIERPSEGAYGYSVLRPTPQSTPRTPQCPEGCPMCYHSTKTPCQHCGCPSVKSGDQGVLGGSVRIGDQGATQRVLGGSLNLPVTKHRSAIPTPDFFSPSSDYYSLSPSSPPPISSPATSSSPQPTTTSQIGRAHV